MKRLRLRRSSSAHKSTVSQHVGTRTLSVICRHSRSVRQRRGSAAGRAHSARTVGWNHFLCVPLRHFKTRRPLDHDSLCNLNERNATVVFNDLKRAGGAQRVDAGVVN